MRADIADSGSVDLCERSSPRTLDVPRVAARAAIAPWERKRLELDLVEPSRAASGHHLATWPDDHRAIPFEFVACALFAAIQEKHSTYCDGVEIANANGVRIRFKGKRLTQVHADVWEGIMHLARGCPAGTKVRFRARAFLRLVGRHTGKSQREQLHGWITDLVATNLEVIDGANRRRYFGSMLPEGARDDSPGAEGLYVVEINRHLCGLFRTGRATINWEQRRNLRGKCLALWLQHYFARFRKPVDVAELHRLSGSCAPLKSFRRNLVVALEELASVGGFVASLERTSDKVMPKASACALCATLGVDGARRSLMSSGDQFSSARDILATLPGARCRDVQGRLLRLVGGDVSHGTTTRRCILRVCEEVDRGEAERRYQERRRVTARGSKLRDIRRCDERG